MLKKIFYWSLAILVFLIIALVGLGWYGLNYLESNDEKLLHEYMGTNGLSVAMRSIDLTIFDDFPEIHLTVDSLVIRDTTKAYTPPTLIDARRIEADISLATLLHRRIRIRELAVHDTKVWIESDSTGDFNTGTWFLQDSTEQESDSGGPSLIALDWEGLCVMLDSVDARFIHPKKRKDVAVLVRAVEATVDRNPDGFLKAFSEIDLEVGQLTFNTEKGGYLQNTALKGFVPVLFTDDMMVFEPTELLIGEQLFRFSAEFMNDGTEESTIRLASDKATYDRTRAVLNDHLQSKVGSYFVADTFPVDATIVTALKNGDNPLVTLDFRLSGNDVDLQQHHFDNVRTTGRLVNRLTDAEGALSDPKKNIRVTTDSISGIYLGKILVEAPKLHMAVAGKAPILTAPVTLSGPASGVSDYLKNDEFFFRRGRFRLKSDVMKVSLMDEAEIVEKTDGVLQFFHTDVYYQPAGVYFPFAKMEVSKKGQDIRFNLKSSPLATGFSFAMEGILDNIAPLLIDEPATRVNTDVTLHTNRITWSDWRALFGQGGRYSALIEGGDDAGEGPRNEGPGTNEPDSTAAQSDARQVAAMKVALLGIKNEFNPNIEIDLDTVEYYDLLALTNFNTGLHFAGDTLVLERTSFDWAGSTMDFGARLDLNQVNVTPFDVDFLAQHLNINDVRSSLEYFGMQLPEGLDELPRDMHIDFHHRGHIADSIGIVPGHNTGELIFHDGRADLFQGQLTYRPGPLGLQSNLHLSGDPQAVNIIFSSENFLFGEGAFELDLELQKTPQAVAELIDYGNMRLRIDSTRIHYMPTDVFIPVNNFSVDIAGNQADFSLTLLTNITQRRVTIDGGVDHIEGFFFPDSSAQSAPLQITADLRAGTLSYADLNEFFEFNDAEPPSAEQAQTEPQPSTRAPVKPHKDSAAVDTSTIALASILSTTGGVFNSFRPNLSVAIDTFWLASPTPIVDISTGLHIGDGEVLVLERSRFNYDKGSFQLDATYQLDTVTHSPFSAQWEIEDLDVGQLVEEFELLGRVHSGEVRTLTGVMNFGGDLSGTMDESKKTPLIDSAAGTVELRLDELVAAGFPTLHKIGKKAWMSRRFDTVALGPTAVSVEVRDGVAYLPRTEIQSTPLQVFIEGTYDIQKGQDLLISVPVFPNLWRGKLNVAPDTTGFAGAGWKIFLILTTDEEGKPKTKVRLGRRKFFKNRGRLEEFREMRRVEKEERRKRRRERRARKRA